jgi:putative toxin-antitoxin system antitoxin component (TIGR02293 family)
MNLVLIEKIAPPNSEEAIGDRAGEAMARAVVNLFRLWGLTEAEAAPLLGGISERTYARWKNGEIGRLSVDLKTRLSVLMGVHKALRIIFTENARAYEWVKKPNEHFGGRRPLDIMLGGQLTDLSRVRHYLDAARG